VTVTIRRETADDRDAIRLVDEEAFGQRDEADLVDALRQSDAAAVSLVAELGGCIVGHILFSPVEIESAARPPRAAGLGPLAVLPEHQRQGIGSRLTRVGLQVCREEGCRAAVVLGNPAFYTRFGFSPAEGFGLRCTFDAPAEAFMAMELVPGSLAECCGLVRFRPEFDEC
jgi:putative acetyltransferase